MVSSKALLAVGGFLGFKGASGVEALEMERQLTADGGDEGYVNQTTSGVVNVTKGYWGTGLNPNCTEYTVEWVCMKTVDTNEYTVGGKITSDCENMENTYHLSENATFQGMPYQNITAYYYSYDRNIMQRYCDENNTKYFPKVDSCEKWIKSQNTTLDEQCNTICPTSAKCGDACIPQEDHQDLPQGCPAFLFCSLACNHCQGDKGFQCHHGTGMHLGEIRNETLAHLDSLRSTAQEKSANLLPESMGGDALIYVCIAIVVGCLALCLIGCKLYNKHKHSAEKDTPKAQPPHRQRAIE